MTKKLSKARIQLIDPSTQEALEDVDILTSAECVGFEDGENLEQKFKSGKLRGQKGDKGKDGVTPDIQVGDVNTLEPGDQVKIVKKGSKERPVFDFSIPRGAKGDSTKEIVDAREATSGETFNTVGDRIDAEISRIREKIEFSHMKQEEELTHKIDNTVDGTTVDMVVKGRTLQNLVPSNGNVEASSKTIFTIQPPIQSNFFKPDTTYTVKFYNFIDSNGNAYIHFSTTETFSIDKVTGVGKFTTKSELIGKGILHYYTTSEHELSELKNMKAIILEGDWTEKEIPPYFEGIKSVAEEENKIEILSCGKNLFDYNFEELKPLSGSREKIEEISNGFRLETVSGQYGCIMKKLQLNKGTYIISCTEKLILGEELVLGGGLRVKCNGILTRSSHKQLQFIVERDNSEVILYYYNGMPTKDKTVVEVSNIQIEEAPSPTEYEPYVSDKTEILLPEEVENGLKGIGDVYDEIVMKEDGVYLIQRIGKKILNGSEEWLVNSGGDKTFPDVWCFYNKQSLVGNKLLLTDKFIVKPGQTNAESIRGGDINTFIFISKQKVKEHNAGEFIKWLQSNNITCYYELKEPVEHKLDMTDINLNTFKGITHITSNNAIKPLLSFNAPINTKERLESLTSANKQLIKESNQLKLDRERQDEILEITLKATNELMSLMEPLLEINKIKELDRDKDE